ncbi:hypothetical protein EVAR_60841_1 [Eumeta japonica]|uniref:Uncharacterized protein n=1 Tax=Eumeta variegata TaxID=151549 RepID=A0A4C1Y5W5_EUMVA|nr:hypothetical protein EVAR_60841_1 [Eumeta japonica]
MGIVSYFARMSECTVSHLNQGKFDAREESRGYRSRGRNYYAPRVGLRARDTGAARVRGQESHKQAIE